MTLREEIHFQLDVQFKICRVYVLHSVLRSHVILPRTFGQLRMT